MKCAVVQDLLPNYCDGLCSQETALEIEKHIADCPVCSSILKDYKSELKSEKEIKNSPEKPFKKLQKKLSRHKFLAISLALCLLVFVGWEGFLTYERLNDQYNSISSIYYTGKVKKIMEDICSGNADDAVRSLDIDNSVFIRAAMLKTETDTDLLDPCREHCKNMINKYYNYIKDKNTVIDIDRTYSYYSGAYDCRFIVKTEGLSDVFFNIMYRPYVYTISCNTDDTNDDFNTFINYELDMSFHPSQSQYNYSTWEMNYINGKMNEDITVAYGRYSDSIKAGEEYTSLLRENFLKIRRSGIHCDEFLKEDLRLDYENGRFLTDIYAVFTDPDTGNKIVYCRTVQDTGGRYVILDEYQPVIIDGGVSPETRELIENIF